VKLSVKNPDVTGNATNPNAPNPNVNLFVKIPPVNPKLNAAHALLELSELLFLFSKKLNPTLHAALAITEILTENYVFITKFKLIIL
jgi:hypothetical protein